MKFNQYDIESVPVESSNSIISKKQLIQFISFFLLLVFTISWIHECYAIYQLNSSNIRRLIRKGPPKSCTTELSYTEEILHSLLADSPEYDCKVYFQTIDQSPLPNPIEALFALSSRITGSVIGQVLHQILQGQDRILQITVLILIAWLIYRIILHSYSRKQYNSYNEEQTRLSNAYARQFLTEQHNRWYGDLKQIHNASHAQQHQLKIKQLN